LESGLSVALEMYDILGGKKGNQFHGVFNIVCAQLSYRASNPVHPAKILLAVSEMLAPDKGTRLS